MGRPILIGLGLLTLALAGCGAENQAAATNDCAIISAEPAGARTAQVEIDSAALRPFGQFNTPDIFRSWGREMMGRMNDVRSEAVSAVAYSAECDRIVSSDLWPLSVAPKAFRIDVVCANRRRFTLAEGNIPQPLESEQRKACRMTPDDVLAICEARLKREGRAGTVAYDESSAVMEEGLWTVIADARLSGPGAERRVRARCTVDSGGLIVNFAAAPRT